MKGDFCVFIVPFDVYSYAAGQAQSLDVSAFPCGGQCRQDGDGISVYLKEHVHDRGGDAHVGINLERRMVVKHIRKRGASEELVQVVECSVTVAETCKEERDPCTGPAGMTAAVAQAGIQRFADRIVFHRGTDDVSALSGIGSVPADSADAYSSFSLSLSAVADTADHTAGSAHIVDTAHQHHSIHKALN